MAGLLGFDTGEQEMRDEFLYGKRSPYSSDNAVNMGLLNMAAVLGTPVRQGGGVGPAFGAFGQGFQSAQQSETRRKLMEAQTKGSLLDAKELERKIAEGDQARELMRQAYQTPGQQAVSQFGGPTVAAAGAMPNMPGGFNQTAMREAALRAGNPTALEMAMRLEKPRNLQTVKSGERVYDMTNPSKPKELIGSLGAEWTLAKVQPFRGQLLYENKVTGEPKVVGSRPLVNIGSIGKQETAESAAVGKYWGDTYGEIQKAGRDANITIGKLNRMESLLEGYDTGRLTPLGTEIAGYMQSAGFNVDPNLDNKQAVISLTRELALAARNPANGAGMPGNFSDQDRNFLVGMQPGLANTPGGNKLIMEVNKRIAKRNVEVSKMATKYRQTHGHLDDGFAEELQRYADANPLFADLQGKTTAAQSSGPKKGDRGVTKSGEPVYFDGTGWVKGTP